MKKQSMLKSFGNFLLFSGLIFLTYYIIFKDQNNTELLYILNNAKMIYIILSILCMIMYFLMESYNVKILLKSLGNNIPILKSLKFTLICYFFNGVTPAASGGQPMEVYYMTKEMIPGSNATLVLLMQMCSFKIGTLCIGTISWLFSLNKLPSELVWLFLLGIAVYCIPLILILICIFSPQSMKKIVNFILKFLNKLGFKKISNKRKRIDETIQKYSESSAYITANTSLILKSIFHGFIQVSFYYLVTFFVYKALGLTGHSVLSIYSHQAMLYCMASWVPLPGAIGASEAIYLALFTPIFSNTYITSALILSRGINFYLFIVVGLITLMVNHIIISQRKIKK